MGKAKEVKETPTQRALADIARQQVDNFEQKWRPLQMKLAKGIVEAGQADSFQRRRADTMAKVDTGVAFAGARDKLTDQAAAGGQLGGSGFKLGLTGMEGDHATSSALSTVAADQANENALVQGLGTVTALGRGEKATAINGLSQAAAISGKQAANDAEVSLQRNMGNAQLAGQVVGMGAGLYQAKPAGDIPVMADPNGMSTNRTFDQLPTAGGR